MDFSIFALPETWITLLVLILLEIALGVDNIVFITITSGRLPEEKRSIGRHVGLIGALCMRILFLCFASYLTSMTTPILNLGFHNFSVKDLVFTVGGIYLIFKGLQELALMRKKGLCGEAAEKIKERKQIGLLQAVLTIMVMDIVFSIDSVITAVGLGNHLIVMILAVIIAVAFMFAFIDPVSNFIDKHRELKMLALVFIIAIGVLLILEVFELCGEPIPGLGMDPVKLVVYSAMFVSLIVVLVRIKLKR